MDNTQIVRPARTYVYLADVGTAAPVNATEAMAVDWHNVGFTTEDSLSFSTEPEFEEVRSAQSDFPTRRFQTTDAATISVELQQWNAENFKAVFGGGSVEEVLDTGDVAFDPPQYKFTPPRLGQQTDKAVVVEVIDGNKHYRFVIPRAQQTEGVEMELQKQSTSNLALSLAVVGGDSTDAWILLTDDPAFAPAA